MMNRTTILKRIRTVLVTAILLPLPWGGAGVGLTSCTDHYDLGKLQNPSKLVVYCFPATDDTTYINVTASVGVKKFTDTRGIRTLDDAQVTYRVNGQKRPVHQLSALLPGVDDAKGVFYVLGGHQPGDRVEIVVSHPDYGEAKAEATVPDAVPVSLDRVVSTTEFDPDWYDTRTFHKLLATFTDPAATKDYYAVRVCEKQYAGSATGHVYEGGQEISTWYISNIDDYRRLCEQYPAIEWEVEVSDSTISWPEIVINDEPLLNPEILQRHGQQRTCTGRLRTRVPHPLERQRRLRPPRHIRHGLEQLEKN